MIKSLGRFGENFCPRRRHTNRVFELGRERAVARYRCPAIIQNLDGRLAEIDHRFHGETHAFVEGHTFTAPLGRTLIYLMTASAGGISFSVGSVTGVLAGAFIGSFIRKEFRWEACEDPRELGRQITGAAMMGVGGVVALGCSIGQGVTAFSTLAFSAPVALASISLGAAFGLRNLLAGFQPE